ncbi:MAG TPA: alpha/beta hydrolase [Tepidisphaeraceae bacterium]|nr:alpha/beta hydrolase [Tepidisphaeraceae bacterium]
MPSVRSSAAASLRNALYNTTTDDNLARVRTVCWILLVTLPAGVCAAAEPRPAQTLKWTSIATEQELVGFVHTPADASSPAAAVVYLKNLSIPRLGTEADASILADLLASGHLVLVLDYANHPRARCPALNADVLKLREDIAGKDRKLLAGYNIDVNRLFILMEGFRLRRDVEFARDADRVLAMDIIYPAQPAGRVPLLMEITCDNVNRMGAYSLLFCRDTLLEGAQAAGFAVAMVDHPVRAPYKGLDDPMPQCIQRMESAVRTLRAMSDELHLSGRIGAIGFSRGGPFAAILACRGQVDAALVHGNRYDYLDLLPDDPMLPRFEKAWGARDQNCLTWAMHGAVHYLPVDPNDPAVRRIAPMFLNTSNTESAEYRDGLAKLARRLRQLGVEHVYREDADGRGHRVSTDPQTLAEIYAFFRRHLAGQS